MGGLVGQDQAEDAGAEVGPLSGRLGLDAGLDLVEQAGADPDGLAGSVGDQGTINATLNEASFFVPAIKQRVDNAFAAGVGQQLASEAD